MTTYYDADFDTQVANFSPKQLEAIRVLDGGQCKYLLYGGAMGGGKSYLLRWYAVRFLMGMFAKYKMRWVQAMVACESYPALKDRQIVKMEREFPRWLGKLYDNHKVYGRCFILHSDYGNGVICLRNLDDPAKYASSEFAFIGVDELTKNLYPTFNDLRTRIRWKGLHDRYCQFLGCTNPGSIGHGWVRNLWMLRSFPEEYYPPMSKADYRPYFHYVQSLAKDNPHLDSSYWSMLSTLPKALRKAFRDGDWNTFIGQAFMEWDPNVHIIEPQPIPENAPIYTTFDWGFGRPFSMGWWWVDSDGRLYRFHERYGWTGEANQGLRMSDKELAALMLLEEEKHNIPQKQIVGRLAGHDCFARKPNPMGGGQGPSTAEEFRKYGVILHPADPSRTLKMRQFHLRLSLPADGSLPMMLVYRTCEQFIRTIPDLVVDKNNIEDVDCFVAGTMISTPSGEVPIEELRCGNLVDTPIGPRKLLKAGKAGRSETICIELSDGTILTATGDHKIFINSCGLLPISKVASGQTLIKRGDCSWVQSFLKGSSSHNVPHDVILNAIQAMREYLEQHSYTGLYGKMSKAQFQTAMSYTIGITTEPTTLLIIWNYLLRLIMRDFTLKGDLERVGIYNVCSLLGGKVMQESGFLAEMLLQCSAMLHSENLRALIVANLLLHDTQDSITAQRSVRGTTIQTDTLLNGVQFAGNTLLAKEIAKKRQRPVVTGVDGNYGKREVYYLTVEQAHLFYANGVLSANTDGEDHVYDDAAQVCMARPLSEAKYQSDLVRTPQEKLTRELGVGDVAAMEIQAMREELTAYAQREGWTEWVQ